MKTDQAKWCWGLVIGLGMVIGGVAEGKISYVVTVVDGMGDSAYSSSRATSINNNGEVAGLYRDPAVAGLRAFLWVPAKRNGTSGTRYDLQFPSNEGIGSLINMPVVLNDQRQMAAAVKDPNNNWGVLLASLTATGGATKTYVGRLPASGGALGTQAAGINSYGQIAAQSLMSATPASYVESAAIWTPSSANGSTGTWSELGTLEGMTYARPYGINAMGQVAGTAFDEKTGNSKTFLWTPTTPNGAVGQMVSIGHLGSGDWYSNAFAINGQGQVVGGSYTGHETRPFIWTPDQPNGSTGKMIDLGVLVGEKPVYGLHCAYGINANGQVVGTSEMADGVSHAFIWTASEGMLDLNTLVDGGGKWVFQEAWGINDSGQIVGAGLYDPDGVGGIEAYERAFVLTLVPEPGSGLLVVAGVAMLARRYRRRG